MKTATTGEQLSVLAHACWNAGAAFRASRRRCKDYAFGRQWNDRIDVDGMRLTEEEYILSQGNIPLKNNLIRRLVRNVLGVFRSRLEQRMESWTPEERQRASADGLTALYARTLEEFLISGMAVHRKWVGERNGQTGVWTDAVSPDAFFFDPAARDPRGTDIGIIGQIHDLQRDAFTAAFASECTPAARLEALSDGMPRVRVIEIWRRVWSPSGGDRHLKPKQHWEYTYISPWGEVLRNGESPFPGGGHPFVFAAYPFLDGEIHSFVGDLIDQQRYTNRLITLYDWVIRASAKGVLLFPEEAVPLDGDIQEIADQWGRFNGVIVYRAKAGQPLPQQVSGNTVNVGIGELLDIQLKMMEDVSGVNAALQGRLENKGMSGTLYNQQTENSMTSLRDILDTFDNFISDARKLEGRLTQM